MQNDSKLTAVIFIGLVLLAATTVWASPAKTYKVTGPVVQISAEKIVVMKNEERYEISRDAATMVEGVVQPGAIVTVTFRMTAAAVVGEPAPQDSAASASASGQAQPAAPGTETAPVPQE